MRLPEMALGVVLIVGGALGASLLATNQTDTIEIVAAARDVVRGQPLETADLIGVEVDARAARALVPTSDAGSLLGLIPAVDIPAGSPILPTTVTDIPKLGPEEQVVALSVEVGDIPDMVGVGDLVRIVLVPDPSLSVETAPTEFQQPAMVWAIERPTESNADYVVSLRVPNGFLSKAAVASRSKIALISEDPGALQ